MAIAKAKCTCCKCGAKFEVTRKCFNRKESDSFEVWAADHFDVCPACEAKERVEKAEALKVDAANKGYAELVGTSKQIIWAEQIRAEKIKEAEQTAKKLVEQHKNEKGVAAFKMCIEHILSHKNKASYWIDNRKVDIMSLAVECYSQISADMERQQESENVAEVKAEATIVPENATHGTVEIRLHEHEITVHYPKDETFRQLAKSLGYSWNGNSWAKKINEYTGRIIDRAAELANSLLNAGFLVELQDKEAREKAISATFEPECKRWIKYFTDEQMLSIILPDDDRSIYDKARAISKKTRYKTGRVLVPIELCDMVEDFANIYDYKISSTANREIAKYRELLTKGELVSQPESVKETDKLKEILKSDDAVLSDLIDD